ncbi:MAG: hypothetical protein O7C75_17540, partial [Verrucomicrobia bacterium]|nr:hypothetical protein [Verrucomicrobiota bacterium]
IAQYSDEELQYKVGERARDTIYANETIRLSDPEKHPDVFTEVRNTIPALYGYRKSASSIAGRYLTNNWNSTRETFISSLNQVFGKRTFRPVEANSAPFGSFIDSFQARNKEYPLSDALARRWATGEAAADELNELIDLLDAFMTAYFIRLDEEPSNAITNLEKVDLITIGQFEPASISDVGNQPMAQIARRQFLPLSQAQEIFPKQSGHPNLALKQYLAQFIQANTQFLENLSIERWVAAQEELKNEVVFQRGDVVVKKGAEITPAIKEALDLMIITLRYSRLKDSVKIELAKEKPALNTKEAIISDKAKTEESTTAPLTKPVIKESEKQRPEGKLPPLLRPTTVAQSDISMQANTSLDDTLPPVPARPDSDGTFVSASINNGLSVMDTLYRWLIGLAIILVVGLLVFLHFRSGPPVYIKSDETPAVIEDHRQTSMIKALTSNLTQTLFRQRQTLLKSKESATVQVAAMENRLAKLQPEIFDKLKAYEEKIKDLEKQLEHRGVSVESLNEPFIDDNESEVTWTGTKGDSKTDQVARPQFEDLEGTVEGEENMDNPTFIRAEESGSEEEKEVPFPGNSASDNLEEEEEPAELMEEVLEDLEAEEDLEKKIAKGFEP